MPQDANIPMSYPSAGHETIIRQAKLLNLDQAANLVETSPAPATFGVLAL